VKLIDVDDVHYTFEHEGVVFNVLPCVGFGPDWIVDQNYWGHTDNLLRQMRLNYQELNDLVEEKLSKHE